MLVLRWWWGEGTLKAKRYINYINCVFVIIPNYLTVVVRGCTATQGNLPNPLPPEGCYDWEEAAYCVCYTSACNKAPMGKYTEYTQNICHILLKV